MVLLKNVLENNVLLSTCAVALTLIHTLRVQYVHDAATLNFGLSKYAKVARMHYFCTIALQTPNASVSVAYSAFRHT